MSEKRLTLRELDKKIDHVKNVVSKALKRDAESILKIKRVLNGMVRGPQKPFPDYGADCPGTHVLPPTYATKKAVLNLVRGRKQGHDGSPETVRAESYRLGFNEAIDKVVGILETLDWTGHESREEGYQNFVHTCRPLSPSPTRDKVARPGAICFRAIP